MGLYVYGCQFAFLQIKGKINSIALVKCKKTQISFEDVVGQVEVTDCESCEVQTLGVLPSITIDKTDGFHLYLSHASAEADITSCASTNMNVTLMGKTEEAEPVEMAISEQF